MTDGNKLQQDRIVRLTDGILAALTGADSTEADTALTLAVVASVYWRTSDAAMCPQAVDGFTQQVREFVQHEDIIERIEALITRAL